MDMALRVTLITGRTAKQGMTMEMGKTTEEYRRAVAVIELSQADAEKLGVSDGDTVSVKTDVGSVVVWCKLSKDLDEGVAFMPYGPWANAVIAPYTRGVGMPQFKSVEAEVSPAPGMSVPTLEELVETLRR